MASSAAVLLESTDDPERWGAACRVSGQPTTAFHSFQFLDVVAQMTDSMFRPLIVRQDGADIGIAPWLSRARGPLSTVNRMPFPYAGPLVPRDSLAPCLAALRHHAIRARAVRWNFQLSPGVDVDPRVLDASGYDVRLDETYVIDTARDSEALWADLNCHARKKIRKAQRAGIEVRPATTGLDTLTNVMDAVYARKGLESGYAAPFDVAVADLNGHGLVAYSTVATLDAVELGSLITLSYEGAALCWVGGVLPEHRATNANVLLFWDAICWAREHGALTLDLVGVPDRGIEQFKRQFGGERREYPVLGGSFPGVDQLRMIARKARSASARRRPPKRRVEADYQPSGRS